MDLKFYCFQVDVDLFAVIIEEWVMSNWEDTRQHAKSSVGCVQSRITVRIAETRSEASAKSRKVRIEEMFASVHIGSRVILIHIAGTRCYWRS